MNRLSPLVLAVASSISVAQTPPMEHVLVSVPLHKKTAETALPITVLTADDLHRAASSSIGDTLSNTPGLANASFGPGVGQPVIRGQQGSRVTVLQNGTGSADASNLSADHAVSVEAMLADSIEILRGPATLLYGGGAIGGVVNVIDGRIPTTVETGIRGGTEIRHDTSSDMDTVVARLDAGVGNFAWHVDGLYRDWNALDVPGFSEALPELDEDPARGTIENTDGRTQNFTLGGSFHFADGFAGLAVSRLENEYGIPAGSHEHHEEGEEEGEDHDEHEDEEGEEDGIRLVVEQTRYDGALHWHNPAKGLEVLRTFLTYTDYEHAEIESDGAIGTVFSNETFEGRLELVHETLGPFHGVVGLQVKEGSFSAIGEEAFVPVTDSRSVGLFLLEDLHWDDWTFEAGMRFDWTELKPEDSAISDESFSGFSASGSATWETSESVILGLAISVAERAPAIEELFSNVSVSEGGDLIVHAATGSVEVGAPDLDTEVSSNIDLSFRWFSDANFVDIKVFYNDFSDYINLVNTGLFVDDAPLRRYTQRDAQFYGVEFDSAFDLMVLGDGQLTLGIYGDSIRGEFQNSEDVTRLPPDKVGVRLEWGNDRSQLWGRVSRASSQNRPGQNETSTTGYTRFDIGADHRIEMSDGKLTLFLELANITDEEIRLSTSFLRDVAPESGRSVELGLRYSF